MEEGTWALAAARNKTLVEDLKKFAKSKGLVD
jgi:hypothetical protein